jgi:DNA-directed RNA polymerase specialized sigma24 family protein
VTLDLSGGSLAERFCAAATDNRAALLRAATRIVGEREAEDVVQDALLRAWAALPRFTVPGGSVDGALRGWLFHVTERRALDVWRHNRLLTWTAYDPPAHDDLHRAAEHDEPEAAYFRRIDVDDAHAAATRVLAGLTREQRWAAWHMLALEQSQGQLAAGSGVHWTAVKSLRYRAVQRARRHARQAAA